MPVALSTPPSIKTVLRDVGILLHIPGLMAVITLPLCVLANELYAIGPFVLTVIAALGIGQLLCQVGSKAGRSNLRFALITVALSWILIPCLGATPFGFIALHLAQTNAASPTVLAFQDPWNALFEAVSGFTSTGLSVTLRPTELPYSLQWWRSFMEWIGGIGVIVLVLAILEPSTDAYQLYTAEGRQKLIGLTVRETVRKIWWIYLIYTALTIAWFYWVGMPWWEALNHALTAISTGGFAVTDDSMGVYGSTVQLAIVPVMVLGAVSFSMHHQLIRHRQFIALWQNSQHRALWLLLGTGAVGLFLENQWNDATIGWVDSLFQWVSALATCGFETAEINTWSPGAKLLLSIAMIMGGTSGSTVGGLKMNRVVVLWKGIVWRFQRLWLRPHQLMRYTLDGEVVPDTVATRRVESVAVLTVLWLGLIGISVFVLLHIVPPEYTLADVLFEAASALGNVGLSMGIVAPDLSWVGKLVLILLMWMGRLEIIPVLLLLLVPIGHLNAVLNQRIRF